MRKALVVFCSCLIALAIAMYCPPILSGERDDFSASSGVSDVQRSDGARRVNITANGSKQNPAWSPDSGSLLFTRFRNGYNVEPADLFVVDTASSAIRTLVSDGSGNVNLPGSSWNPLTRKITFSSSRDPHDEIYLIADAGIPGDEIEITARSNLVAYEPSLSPDGQWIVFESHKLDVEDNGILVKYRVDRSSPYQNLTSSTDDCRQPNWSPVGDKILFQKFSGGQWDIWVMNIDGTNPRRVTSGAGDKTDGSFSPDGKWIVYSSDQSGLAYANLFIIPTSGGSAIRVTQYAGYDGAPSWSPDGGKIAFESYPGDPDGSAGTTIWVIDVPAQTESAVFRSMGVYDGWILESGENTNTGGTLDSTATSFNLGDGAGDKQYRAILSFNTAALPDNAVITGVRLKIRKMDQVGTNPFTILDGLKVDIRKPYFGTGLALVVGDFQAAAGRAAVGTFGSTPVSNWYSAVIGSAGYPYINKTGATQFRLRFLTDDNNDNAADYMKFYSGDYTASTSRPVLVIQYYIP